MVGRWNGDQVNQRQAKPDGNGCESPRAACIQARMDLYLHGLHLNFARIRMVKSSFHSPLAERLRPLTLSEVIGQQHLFGDGMPLRIAFETGQPHSCILWGPLVSAKRRLPD